MQLGQAVDRLREEVGRRVVEVIPARIVGRVAQAEVRSQVDDRASLGDEVRHERRRCAVGQREEDGIRRGGRGVDVQAGPAEVRMDLSDRLLLAAAPDESDDADVGMPREQPDRFRAGIAGGADDGDIDQLAAARGLPGPVLGLMTVISVATA